METAVSWLAEPCPCAAPVFTVTIGPSRPRLLYGERASALPSLTILHQLARLASRHGPTTVLDGQGGAMVLGAPAGEIDLF